ncbi:putative bis(5'-adenosyl)-triphosphatase [Babesia divergens]|uniref:Bis(5'-adenosyl)-triphosphatase n=1 Tax=Babesia divergens TaxID=32595 RepID=A0AAD9GD90_BABDI|nr:putative bis(5'-adenosyl)-triphosphatase [Babesia divergens]
MASRVFQAFDATSALQMTENFYFGKIKLPSTQVFAVSRHSFAFVNIKPFMPGHSLVSPSRIVKRFKDMTAEELLDFNSMVQVVAEALELKYDGTASSIVIQDGEAAGQTIPHVHAHIIPRHFNDLERPDSIYAELEKGDQPRRTQEEMAITANETRPFIEKVITERLVGCLQGTDI